MRRPAPSRGRGLVLPGETLQPPQKPNTRPQGLPRVQSAQNQRTAAAMEMCAPPPKPLPRIVILDFTPFRDGRGGWFEVVDNEIGIIIKPCSLRFNADGAAWIGLPASPRLRNGAIDPGFDGKPQYTAHLKIVPRPRYESFVEAALAALRDHPEAGRCFE